MRKAHQGRARRQGGTWPRRGSEHLRRCCALFRLIGSTPPRPQHPAPQHSAAPRWPQRFDGLGLASKPRAMVHRFGTRKHVRLYPALKGHLTSPMIQARFLASLGPRQKQPAAFLSPQPTYVLVKWRYERRTQMANRNVSCMTNTAIVRELYWGCGGGVMQCFSSAVTTAVLNEENHPSCRISAPRQNQDMPVASRKRDRQNR